MFANCKTFRLNLLGPALELGIEVNEKGDPKAVELVGGKYTSFYRAVPLDYNNEPPVVEGRILRAQINQYGRLVMLSQYEPAKVHFLVICVGDERVKKLDADLNIRVVLGNPYQRELVRMQGADGRPVGFQAFYAFKNGDLIMLETPLGHFFLGCFKGELIQLPDTHPIAARYFARLQAENECAAAKSEAEALEEAARREELARKQAEFDLEAAQNTARAEARALAQIFPRRPPSGDWNLEIEAYIHAEIPVKEAFLEVIFSAIASHLSRAMIDEKGMWHKRDVFAMHFLNTVCSHSHFPKNFLSKARTALKQLSLRQKAELPYLIVQKFNLTNPHTGDVKVEDLGAHAVANNARKHEAEKKREERRIKDAELRSNMRGKTGSKPKKGHRS